MAEILPKTNSLYNNMNLNAKSIESFESSIKSMLNAKVINKRNHQDYRTEKIFELGLEYETSMKKGDYERAINVAKKLIFFEKDIADHYILLASGYIKIFDISSAITCYRKYCL